jgi:hypothetical protein
MAVEKTIKLKVDSKEAVKGIDQVEKGVKGVDKSAKGAKTGLGAMTGAAKGLGVAFKALGIGLIVAAFMKLRDIFSGNIETARMFERVTSQLSAAFDVIRDRAETFIKTLIKLKNPLKAFREAFTGTTAEIREETKAMAALTKQLQTVRDEERQMLVIRAKANQIIAESRLLAEDETLTMEERLVALKAAVAEEQRVAALEIETQQKKVDALQAVIDLGKSSEEDMIELENQRARLIDLQTQSVLKQKRVVTEIVTFEKQIETERKKNADAETKRKEKEAADKQKQLDKDKADADKKAEKLRVEKEKELEILRTAGMSQQELELDQAKQKYDKLIELSEKYGLDTTVITDKYNSQVLDINKKYAKEEEKVEELTQENKRSIVANSLGQVASLMGEESKGAKALAVGQALINTYQAATAALAPPPVGAGPIFGPIAAVGAVAAGMANVKQILATKLPGADGGGGGGVPEPSIPNASQGIGPLTPNMEAIEQPTLGGTQPAQAYVIESDISNAQALQEELEIQATL